MKETARSGIVFGDEIRDGFKIAFDKTGEFEAHPYALSRGTRDSLILSLKPFEDAMGRDARRLVLRMPVATPCATL